MFDIARQTLLDILQCKMGTISKTCKQIEKEKIVGRVAQNTRNMNV